MKFFEMGNGNLLDVTNRRIAIKDILKYQETDWAKKQGGICGVRELTEDRAIFFAKLEMLKNKINN